MAAVHLSAQASAVAKQLHCSRAMSEPSPLMLIEPLCLACICTQELNTPPVPPLAGASALSRAGSVLRALPRQAASRVSCASLHGASVNAAAVEAASTKREPDQHPDMAAHVAGAPHQRASSSNRPSPP